MPCDEQHCFHAGCLTVCLKEHFTYPLCYDETLRRAHRAQCRACHPDKVARRHRQEIASAADPGAKHQELADAARLMTQDITTAYETLQDRQKRRDYDLGRGTDAQKRPPPSILHRISRDVHESGGKIPIAKNRVDTTITLPPGASLPYVVRLGPESGQPAGTTITIELEASDAPISRQQIRVDLGGVLPTATTTTAAFAGVGFADEAVQQKVRDVREIVSACDTMWRHGKHDARAAQAQKVLKVVRVDSALQKNLAKEATVHGEKGHDVVSTCEISAKESHFGGIRRTIPLPGGDTTFELDYPLPIEAN
eukprot:COSAG06_NODE_17656_length_928_cov_0.937274_1_plen_309_part_11